MGPPADAKRGGDARPESARARACRLWGIEPITERRVDDPSLAAGVTNAVLKAPRRLRARRRACE
jgi:hypothetical protein